MYHEYPINKKITILNLYTLNKVEAKIEGVMRRNVGIHKSTAVTGSLTQLTIVSSTK